MDQHPWLDTVNNQLLIVTLPAALLMLTATACMTMRLIREIDDRRRIKKTEREFAEAEREQAAFDAEARRLLSTPLRDDGPMA